LKIGVVTVFQFFLGLNFIQVTQYIALLLWHGIVESERTFFNDGHLKVVDKNKEIEHQSRFLNSC